MVAQRAVEGRRHALVGDRGDRTGAGRAAGGGRPVVTGAVVREQGHRHDPDRAGALCHRRRRRQLPVRAGARHRPRPHVPPGHGDSRLLHQPAPRRPLDREPPRHPRPGRQPFARLWVDIPGRRRHGERRRRAPVDVHRLEERQHQPSDGRLLRHRARAVGDLARDRDRRADRRQAPDRRVGDARGSGPTHLVVGDAAGSVNPFNGEGISLAYETGRLAADAVDLALVTGDRAALETLLAAARRGVRPLLQGRSYLCARHREPGGDARAHPRRDAEPHAHGVGAADHGQPDAPRRARSRGGRVPRGGRDRRGSRRSRDIGRRRPGCVRSG